MLNFTDVTLRRGPRVLLERLSWTVYDAQRVGIVGRNGTGKSSLFAMVMGELAPDAGDLQMPRDLAVAHVRQDTPALDCAALDYVLDGDAPWRALSNALTQAEASGDPQRLAGLHERMHAIDGYTASARAARLLYGLGFAAADAARPVRDFSGGWRMRLNLAQALMCRSDLLLLDEPTNHLDLDAVVWLQAHLAAYPGTLLLISHDRDFLDAVTTHTLHLEGGQAIVYTGNYSSSERQRAERLAQQAAQYSSQVRRAEELQRFIDRFRAKASKARQAQSRIKQLERMQIEAPAHWDAPFRFAFAEPAKLPAPLLRLDKVAVGHDGAALLSEINLTLRPGDRLALLGRNGAGKTTLMRALAGLNPVLSGEMMRDKALAVGYFDQHQVDALRGDQSPMAHLQVMDPEAREQDLRDFLGGFDFRDQRVFEPVAPFSGGERARLALALLVYRKPNLLVLDEPTNHLDLDMRHALELALQAFAGAVVLVSHDRHLVSTCCDELWLVGAGRVEAFNGDLDDYAEHLRQVERQAQAAAGDTMPARASARDQRRAAADQRAREKPLRDALRQAERQLDKLNAQLAELQHAMADPDLYTARPDEAARLARQQGQLAKQLEQAETDWMTAAEALEGFQAEGLS